MEEYHVRTNEKNNVDSTKQTQERKLIKIHNVQGQGIRVMFVGNSITLHGIKEDIGWLNEWGMAASDREKDYVHLMMNEISAKVNDAVYCICNVADWESNYKNGSKVYDLYVNARDFHADIIVARFIENCPCNEFDIDVFKKEYSEFIDYLNGAGKQKLCLQVDFGNILGIRPFVRLQRKETVLL